MKLGIKINFVNFIAFPITFGIGVDYAVNVMARYLRDGERDVGAAVRGTGGAVGLCSLTTIIGYSSLLVAQNVGAVSLRPAGGVRRDLLPHDRGRRAAGGADAGPLEADAHPPGDRLGQPHPPRGHRDSAGTPLARRQRRALVSSSPGFYSQPRARPAMTKPAAQKPAATSSSMTPGPPWRRSAARAGQGLS